MNISRWIFASYFLLACGGTKSPDPQHTPEPPIISVPQVVDAGAGNDSPATSKLPDAK